MYEPLYEAFESQEYENPHSLFKEHFSPLFPACTKLGEGDYFLSSLILSVMTGTILNRSATMPYWATPKMGALGSLLMAMIVPAPFIPAICWQAPVMPVEN